MDDLNTALLKGLYSDVSVIQILVIQIPTLQLIQNVRKESDCKSESDLYSNNSIQLTSADLSCVVFWQFWIIRNVQIQTFDN